MDSDRRCWKLYALMALGLVAVLWLATSPARADPPTALTPNPQAERWVLEQISAGKIADLTKEFPAEADRALSSEFLQQLLTDSVPNIKIPHQGVRILYAVFPQPVELRNAQIASEVVLAGCRFDDSVDFSESVFQKSLNLSESTFKAISLSGAKLHSHAVFLKSVFNGPVDFSYAEIARDLLVGRAQFSDTLFGALFYSLKVGGSAGFDNVVFDGPVTFSEAAIGLTLALYEAQFKDTKVGAKFNNISVGEAATMNSAVFAGPVSLTDAHIGGEFTAIEARFTDPSRGVVFDAWQVEGAVSMANAEFAGPVSCISGRIGSWLMFSQARFTDAKSAVIFNTSKVAGPAFFRGAYFAGGADFSRVEVGQDFDVSQARFDQAAKFPGLRVGGHGAFNETVFDKQVDFGNATFALDFNAGGLQINDPEDEAIFTDMKVAGYMFISSAQFAGAANFNRLEVGRELIVFGAHFKSKERPVVFSMMQVGGYASFSDAVFDGPADFSDARIQVGLQLDSAHFTNPDRDVNFSDMQVAGYVLMAGAVFSGQVEFVGLQVGSNFMADTAQFGHAEKLPSFLNMKVGGSAFFRNALFIGPADFRYITVAVNLELNETQFKNSTKAANFGNMSVGNIASFSGTVFSGPAVFIGATVKGQFLVTDAQFKEPERAALFNGMEIGDSMILSNGSFAGPVSIADANVLDLSVVGTPGISLTIPSLELSRMTVKRELRLENMKMGDFLAHSMVVGGPAIFTNVTITGTADVEHSKFQSLSLSNVSWPLGQQTLRLDGIEYQYISAGPEKDSWLTLLRWLNGSVYSANVYANLSAFFQKQGYTAQSSEVFVAQRRRERAELLGGPVSLAWWWNLFLDGLVRYGRSPDRALLYSLLLVVIGCIAFRPRHMEPADPENPRTDYNPLWYSLDLFVPILNLQAVAFWSPRADLHFVRHYARLHRILGWLLVPIGLAAVTGLIK